MAEAIEMRDLEAFVAVADTGSFTSAAQLLFLTQPTVSTRIASLEAVLSTRLLDRGAGPIRPTPAGEILLVRARDLLRDRDEAVSAVQDFLGTLGGRLDVGASSVPGSYLLPRVIVELRAAHPDLRVNLSVEDTDRAIERLRRRDVELAVVGRSVPERGFDECIVGEDEIVLVATPELGARILRAAEDRPRGAAHLFTRIPLVLREQGSATRAASLAALEAAGVDVARLDVVLEIGGNAAVVEAALQGIGAAFLSRLAVENHLGARRLVLLPFPGSPLVRPLVLITRSNRTLSPAARELARRLKERREA